MKGKDEETRTRGTFILIYSSLYIGFLVIADILAARYIVPIGLGLAVPAGVFSFAPCLTLRDRIHDFVGRRGVYPLIALASVLSLSIAWATGSTKLMRVVVASVIAFVLNETLDTEVYQVMRSRGYKRIAAILTSNTFSAALDSVLFIGIAFGFGLWRLMLGQYIVKMVLAGLVGLFFIRE